ncbi:hypothetical protein SCOCK_610040 [Actinacidiphila cocklensis]|uniref:Uncharacterized protein n=1 Tax=Actinacidiphila cocklensis TaxID=887465 RepID=A0A9W4DZ27_9ACTN|nr:hypothetical protein SCOCK_610040 [Actinacidiphila cocklensis]
MDRARGFETFVAEVKLPVGGRLGGTHPRRATEAPACGAYGPVRFLLRVGEHVRPVPAALRLPPASAGPGLIGGTRAEGPPGACRAAARPAGTAAARLRSPPAQARHDRMCAQTLWAACAIY